MKTVLLRPAPGRRVRDPLTQILLPAEGAVKPLDTFWIRRLSDGDVVEPLPEAPLKTADKKKE